MIVSRFSLSRRSGLTWMARINVLVRSSAADPDSPAYANGFRARLANCYRALACPENDQELVNWLAGWDAADASLKGGAV
jgi:hypothetical protein